MATDKKMLHMIRNHHNHRPTIEYAKRMIKDGDYRADDGTLFPFFALWQNFSLASGQLQLLAKSKKESI